MTPTEVADRINGLRISDQPDPTHPPPSTAATAAAASELPRESPEIHALLAKLQDVATAGGGCLQPEWGEAEGVEGAPAYEWRPVSSNTSGAT
ncbi:unnamed protein product, partial [Sphacelaria rigidula]